MVRFIHTSDWQLGMPARFLNQAGRSRFHEERLAVVKRIGELAGRKQVNFVVVAGDIFEDFVPDPPLIDRVLHIIKDYPCPVYLLPGNHDHAGPGCLWEQKRFTSQKPANVHVLLDEPIRQPAYEVVGVPLRTYQPGSDPMAPILARLQTSPVPRILVAHGQLTTQLEGLKKPGAIDAAALLAARTTGLAQYVALGDRHSAKQHGDGVWHSGTPVVTDLAENDPSHVLLVDLDKETTEKILVTTWRFEKRSWKLTDAAAVESLAKEIAAIENPETRFLSVELEAHLGLADLAQLNEVLERAESLLAGLRFDRRDVHVLPNPEQVEALHLQGYAAKARDELAELAKGAQSAVAQDALLLLWRLRGPA